MTFVRVALALAAVVVPACANDVLHMDKKALRALYSMYGSNSPIDRRLADPSEDDAELRAFLFETLELDALCDEGVLRNAGTEAEPLIGCCHPDCFMCMARGCGAATEVTISELPPVFPEIAPVCCYSFVDYRVDTDRGMVSRECSDPSDVGCMLPVAYNQPEEFTNVVAVFDAVVTEAINEENFCRECFSQALASLMTTVNGPEDIVVTRVEEEAGRRRKLQIAGGKGLAIDVTVAKTVGAGEDKGTLEDAIVAELSAIQDNGDGELTALGTEYAAAVAEDDSIEDADGEGEVSVKGELIKTSFEGVGSISVSSAPFVPPTAAPTPLTDNPDFSGAAASSQRTSQSSFYNNGPLASFLAAFILVVALLGAAWVRRKRQNKQTAAALLALKLDPYSTLVDRIGEHTHDGVYLPPTLPGRSSRGGSSHSGSQAGTSVSSSASGQQPRAWERPNRRPSFSGSQVSRDSFSHSRSARSISSASDMSDNRSADSRRARVVMNELDMLTRPKAHSMQPDDAEASDEV